MRLDTVKTVAIVSDTHGHLNERIAEVIQQCDIAVHAGDVGNAQVVQAMQPKLGQVYLVKGNNDVASKWPAEQKSVLAQLQECITLELMGGQLVVLHKTRWPHGTACCASCFAPRASLSTVTVTVCASIRTTPRGW